MISENCRDNEQNSQMQIPNTDSEPIHSTDVLINNEHSLLENDNDLSHDSAGSVTEME
jgi:hypothetical protein